MVNYDVSIKKFFNLLLSPFTSTPTLDHDRSRSFSFNKSALTETDQDQQPFIIPRMAIHPSSSPSDKEPDVKPKAEAEVEKKGAMGALRK